MQPSAHQRNRRAFEDPETVASYADSHGLTPCELQLFDRYVPSGSNILDLGVGTGRTTPYLSGKARRYVGVDYAAPMVQVCRERFPELTFHEADASDLGRFDDETFDAVVFSFNGIDYISPASRRQRCLAECQRVLRRRGVLVVSRHNPRAIVRLPPPRPGRSLGVLLRSMAAVPMWTLRRTIRMAISGGRTFWRGEGTIVEPALGFNTPLRRGSGRCVRPRMGARGSRGAGQGQTNGRHDGDVVTHMATPRRVRQELARAGFDVLAVAGSSYPRYSGTLVTPWYYYAAVKRHGQRL